MRPVEYHTVGTVSSVLSDISGDNTVFEIVLNDPMRKRMLPDLKGKKVEIVLGVFDAVEGEVVDADERWLTLRNKRRLVYVQIDKIRHLACSNR